MSSETEMCQGAPNCRLNNAPPPFTGNPPMSFAAAGASPAALAVEAGASSMGAWNEWARHILYELQRLNGQMTTLSDQSTALRESVATQVGSLRTDFTNEQSKMRADFTDKLGEIKTEVAMLKVKSGLWGAAAGGVLVIGTLIAAKFK